MPAACSTGRVVKPGRTVVPPPPTARSRAPQPLRSQGLAALPKLAVHRSREGNCCASVGPPLAALYPRSESASSKSLGHPFRQPQPGSIDRLTHDRIIAEARYKVVLPRRHLGCVATAVGLWSEVCGCLQRTGLGKYGRPASV